jgi:hypothetical protein
MSGFPSLQQMVSAELARRENANAVFQPFTFTVCDNPGATTDVTAAVAAIEEELKTRGCERRRAPVVARDIQDAVCEALQAAHPRLFQKLGKAPRMRRISSGAGMSTPIFSFPLARRSAWRSLRRSVR